MLESDTFNTLILNMVKSKRLNGEYADVAVVSIGFDADGKSNVRFDPKGIVASKELDAGVGGSKIGARVGVAMAV
ncbi:MAG: hypothetical protein K6C99_01680 [Lachnospiraceae bacterium]|nr:hypothetical protein [Lachnospiraceae bacterium]